MSEIYCFIVMVFPLILLLVYLQGKVDSYDKGLCKIKRNQEKRIERTAEVLRKQREVNDAK